MKAPNPTGQFKTRGFHLDLRIQVMTPPALNRLADELAAAGFNLLVIEWEASFPYARNATISHERAYRPQEVRQFLAHCRDLGLEVVPLQQTLGHLEHVLRHPRYAPLREDEDDRCQLCPRREEVTRPVIRSLFADLREYHTGPWLHIGGDEAYLLGHCPLCRAFVAQHSLSRLYAEHMVMVIEEAKAAGFRPLLWADMLLKHPDCVDLLPRDTVLIDWNYGWAFDRFGQPQRLLDAGFEVWGAAALRSAPDNHSLTYWQRHLHNFCEFVPEARALGYQAMILTSWSTSGVFGYWWDDGKEVLDLLPVRRAYPLSGHRILLLGFTEILTRPATFCPRDFVSGYGRDRFGFGEAAAELFADALLGQAPASAVPPPGKRLADVIPVRNQAEFAHLRLLETLHGLHGEFLGIAKSFQSADYTRLQAITLKQRLEPLIARSRECTGEYRGLQEGYLNPDDIELDVAYRERAHDLLWRVLQNQSA